MLNDFCVDVAFECFNDNRQKKCLLIGTFAPTFQDYIGKRAMGSLKMQCNFDIVHSLAL